MKTVLLTALLALAAAAAPATAQTIEARLLTQIGYSFGRDLVGNEDFHGDSRPGAKRPPPRPARKS